MKLRLVDWLIIVTLLATGLMAGLVKLANAAPPAPAASLAVEIVDLSISIPNPPAVVHYNDTGALNYVIHNAGPSDAREVTVAVIVPAEFRVRLPILVGGSGWHCTVADAERAVPRVLCSIPRIGAGLNADLSLSFQVNYAPPGTAIHTRAWVGSLIPDVNWSNDIYDQLSMMQ